MKEPVINQLEFNRGDHEAAAEMARRLNYKQTAYTSTSSLWGLFCLPENPEQCTGPTEGGCIIKTKQFGLMFIQDLEDLHMEDIQNVMD